MSSIFTIISLLVNTCWSVTYLESQIPGKSMYYGGNPSGGACGYATVETATFPFGYYAGCGDTVFDDGYGCGKCYEITCIGPYTPNPSCYCSSTTPSVIISCMDQCPDCDSTTFDLDPTAFARIVGPGLSGTCGQIETTVRRVTCEYLTNIKIRAKSGTSAYWFGFHIDNIAGYGAVSAALVKSFGSSTYDTTCDKSAGASHWLCAGGYPLVAPLTLKLTNDNNEVVILDDCITNFNGGAEFDCGTNFGVGATPTAATPSPTSSPTAGSPTISPITASPTLIPTYGPTTAQPTNTPSVNLILSSTSMPTGSPTITPTTSQPTNSPSHVPTVVIYHDPSFNPTRQPTRSPTEKCLTCGDGGTANANCIKSTFVFLFVCFFVIFVL